MMLGAWSKVAESVLNTTYNNPSYSRSLIGCCLSSITGQTHDCRHHYKVFSCVLRCRKVLGTDLDNILRDWAKDRVQKRFAEALNWFEKQQEER